MITPDVISIAEPANREVLRKKEEDLRLKSNVFLHILMTPSDVLSHLVAKWVLGNFLDGFSSV